VLKLLNPFIDIGNGTRIHIYPYDNAQTTVISIYSFISFIFCMIGSYGIWKRNMKITRIFFWFAIIGLIFVMNGLLFWLEVFVWAPIICNHSPSCTWKTQVIEILHIVLLILPLQSYFSYLLWRFIKIGNDYVVN